MTMAGVKMLVAAALMSTIAGTSALAQAAMVNPDAFEAEYPNRDALNGGALTSAGRMGLEESDGAVSPYAANNARAEIGPSFRTRHFEGRRHHYR
jgi:hypothetical protein